MLINFFMSCVSLFLVMMRDGSQVYWALSPGFMTGSIGMMVILFFILSLSAIT